MPSTRSTVRGRRLLPRPVAAFAALLIGPVVAHASVASRETADQILAQAGTGATAPQILKASFPAASLRAAADVPVRVLVADLAPRITLAAHGHPVLRARGRRIALVADHRYVVSHARTGWRVRDLDGPRTIRRIRGAAVRFDAGSPSDTVLLADPLGRRFHGALELRTGEHRTISVINVVRLEHWIEGAIGGDIPSTWSASPTALDLAAILTRSRALGTLRAKPPGWDLTSDEPVYLGVDGEQPALKAAADRTSGQAAWVAGAPLDGTISFAGAAPLPFTPDPGTPRKVALAPARPIAGAPAGQGPRAVELARTRIGTPYRWGGSAPGGFDCSGLVFWIYGRLGIRLPRVAEDQGTVGVPVADGELAPGDVVFFADGSGYVHHEGIYIGGGQMIHAPQSGDVVKIERIDTGYYARQFAGARRFSPST